MNEEEYEVQGGAVIVVICLVSIVSAALGCGVTWVLMHMFGW